MTDARQVPAIVATLQADLLRPGFKRYMQMLMASTAEEQPSKHVPIQPSWGMTWCEDVSNRLNITRLFHVSEPMLAVSIKAAEQLDNSDSGGDISGIPLHWHDDSFPSRDGFLIYEQPLEMTDIWNGPVHIAAVMWSWDPGYADKPGWHMTLFARSRDMVDHEESRADGETIAQFYQSSLGSYIVFETSFLRIGQRVGEWVGDTETRQRWLDRDRGDDTMQLPELDPHKPTSTMNLGRINWTVFQLMNQVLADVTEETDRRLARRNHGKKRPPSSVTVIELRRREHYGARDEGSGRWLTYRSITSGHWRRQHYGPKREAVKRIWVSPYIRGPEDAPFYQTKRVSTLKR